MRIVIDRDLRLANGSGERVGDVHILGTEEMHASCTVVLAIFAGQDEINSFSHIRLISTNRTRYCYEFRVQTPWRRMDSSKLLTHGEDMGLAFQIWHGFKVCFLTTWVAPRLAIYLRTFFPCKSKRNSHSRILE